MLVTCPQCQGYTEIEPGQPGLITCRICKHEFTPGHDPLFGDEPEDVTAIGPTHNQRRVLAPKTGDPFSRTSPPPNLDFANLTGDNFEALGGLQGDHDALDFDEVTRQSDVGDLSLLMGAVDDEEESTIAVPADVADDLAAQLNAASQAPAAPPIWRVRSARGLVYELMSLDAVVAWLEGKADISGVRIARGQGEFTSISSHPELAERFGGRTVGPSRLELSDLPVALDDRPGGHTSAPPSGPEVSPLRGDAADAPERPARADDPRRPIGFSGVLGVAIICGVLIAGAVFFGMRSGWLSSLLPPAPPPAEAPVSPALQAAIDSFEANNLTSAINALQKQAREGQDPRALRYLAMALHRQKRHHEARDALMRYQRAMEAAD